LDQPEKNVLQPMSLTSLLEASPSSSLPQPSGGNFGAAGLSVSKAGAINAVDESAAQVAEAEPSLSLVEMIYNPTGSSQDLEIETSLSSDFTPTNGPYYNYVPWAGGDALVTNKYAGGGNSASTHDAFTQKDAYTTGTYGIAIGDNQSLNLAESPTPGKFCQIVEEIGGSNTNGVVENFQLVNTSTGVQIPANSVVTYTAAFTISYGNGGQTSPAPTEFSLAFSFHADGISATISGGQLQGSYSTPSGTVNFSNPNFQTSQGSFTCSIGGSKTGNTSSVGYSSENSILIDGGESESNSDSFVWSYTETME
jgi:hypothetical protein